MDENTEKRSPESFKSFFDFVKQHLNVILATSGFPILSDFFGLHPPGDEYHQKLLATVTALLCSLVLVALFYGRYAFARRSPLRFVGLGIFVCGLGLAMVLGSAWPNSPANVATPVFLSLLYVAGFVLACVGAAVVFLYEFVSAEEISSFANVIARLEAVEVKQLEAIAQAMESGRMARISGNDGLAHKVRDAFKKSSHTVIRESAMRVARITDGSLEIWGPDMNDVYGNFSAAVETRFRALTNDDMNYWANSYSDRYLDQNRMLLARNCTVERIFLIPSSASLEPRHRDALKKQIEMGIHVRIALLDHVRDSGIDVSRLDFGLLDDFAVSHWRFNNGRLFRLSVSQEKYGEHAKLYEEVKSYCVRIPGKTSGDTTRFETIEELSRWMNQAADRAA